MLRSTTSAPVEVRSEMSTVSSNCHRRIQEFVDRRADDDHHMPARRTSSGSKGHLQSTGLEDGRQEGICAVLDERHLGPRDLSEDWRRDVIDAHSQASVGKGQAQRETDMPRAANHDHV